MGRGRCRFLRRQRLGRKKEGRPELGKNDGPVETARATFEANQRDYDEERDRSRTLDGKLTNLAAFSAISLSVAATLGSRAISPDVSFGFAVATAALLSGAGLALLACVLVAFGGLRPKLTRGIKPGAVEARTSTPELARNPSDALARFAATLAVQLRRLRKVNSTKARTVTRASRLAAAGVAGLSLALLVSSVGAIIAL